MRSIELTASNMATWVMAMIRSAGGGPMLRLSTKATAFSFQSVMTSADAGWARPIKAMAAKHVAMLAFMGFSL